MKLVVLSEVKAMDGFGSEHGLSFLIEVDQEKVLFDTGASDLYLKNAQKLGIDPNRVDTIVLSHGHWDHGDGLQFTEGLPLVCHPGCFVTRFRKSGFGNIGLALSQQEIESRFELKTSAEPVRLTEHLWFLGEIPRVNDFEARSTRYVLEGGQEDFLTDDSGLVCITDRGLVVISGCAHSGICNMVEHARQLTGINRVEGVIGGFHLRAVNDQARKTIEYLKYTEVRRIYPSHCTMDPALSQFYDEFGFNEVLAGSTIDF